MTYDSRINLLRREIKLQEYNYQYAVESQKGINIQIDLREHINKLKDELSRLENTNPYRNIDIATLIDTELWSNN